MHKIALLTQCTHAQVIKTVTLTIISFQYYNDTAHGAETGVLLYSFVLLPFRSGAERCRVGS